MMNEWGFEESSVIIEELLKLPIAELPDAARIQIQSEWSDEKKEAIIVSILNKRAIGWIAINEKNQLVDGHQTYRAIKGFAGNQFTYRGETFSEWSEDLKTAFLSYSLTLYTLNPEKDIVSPEEFFAKMNLTNSTPKELNHGE